MLATVKVAKASCNVEPNFWNTDCPLTPCAFTFPRELYKSLTELSLKASPICSNALSVLNRTSISTSPILSNALRMSVLYF